MAEAQQRHPARHHAAEGVAPMDGSLLPDGGTEPRMVVRAGRLLADRRPSGAQHRGYRARPRPARAARDGHAAAPVAGPPPTTLAVDLDASAYRRVCRRGHCNAQRVLRL
ncbi:MAG: hypothetical protein J5616_04355 [Bacteroidaceae bacterium]|nr:hypothetical protein [Bacteroidaceae bacterium]